MANKTLSTRISEQVEQFLVEKFGTASSGLSQCAEIVFESKYEQPHEIVDELKNLDTIRRYTFRGLRGRFTENEWNALADSLNGTMITPDFRCVKEGLAANIEDSAHFDGIADKWEIDLASILDKINNLTAAEVDAVYWNIGLFWSDPNSRKLM